MSEKDVVLGIAEGRVDPRHLSSVMRDAKGAGDWDTCVYCGEPVPEDEDRCDACKAKQPQCFTSILRRGGTEEDIDAFLDDRVLK